MDDGNEVVLDFAVPGFVARDGQEGLPFGVAAAVEGAGELLGPGEGDEGAVFIGEEGWAVFFF